MIVTAEAFPVHDARFGVTNIRQILISSLPRIQAVRPNAGKTMFASEEVT